ncbi:MAG: IS200/IS605 family element transposase accessory protein TnpB, partial [Candidatus Lokiarchaeota archaeon]|nr:IS200/IS605 family element transposase accessory protein TnpB [Candidatus Lokiarchaeota archaeon]
GLKEARKVGYPRFKSKKHKQTYTTFNINNNIRLFCVYEKIDNQKRDWTHKTTLQLANIFDTVILEDLNIKGMQQFNSGLSKSVTLNFSWDQFKTILNYKLEWRGKHYQEIDNFFPSSQLCSVCGYKHEMLCLSEGEWTCPECGTHHHRDKKEYAS